MSSNPAPHLQSKVAAYLERSDEERIRYIRSPRWIGYPRAQEILDQLEELITYPKSHRMPNLLIVGDTNNGKTMLVERFCRSHKPDDNPEGEASIVPVLCVQGECQIFCVNGVLVDNGESIAELNGKTSQRCFPVSDRHRPFLADIA